MVFGASTFFLQNRPHRKFLSSMHQKYLQEPANGPTEIIKSSLEHFYVLKSPISAHKNAPKMVRKFQLAHLLAPEAIFGALMTEICDSGDFEGKMLKPRKSLTVRSRVIILFIYGQKWTKF